MVTEIVIFGIVWGVLLIYFLTPFKSMMIFESQKDTKLAFINVFKDSLIKIIKHKKAILALIMLIITLIYIWYYHSQLEWYNQAHGVEELSTKPKQHAIYYIVSVIVYSVILYIFVALRRTLILIKKF
ncbi:hypothetical protein [Bacillus sp. EB01]|uniref:hypothetical protein n=1 Tax=Bacillus sp. EB01 TaxID=1347086 RepID=UPI0005C6DA19|nr:hypothetical protein [Bacillus sp. EB01]